MMQHYASNNQKSIQKQGFTQTLHAIPDTLYIKQVTIKNPIISHSRLYKV